MPNPVSLSETSQESRFLDDATRHCAEQGGELTPLRRQVLHHLLRAPGGVKAYDLLARIREHRPGAAPPTVYRALSFLIDHGLAHKIGSANQFIACNRHDHEDASLFLVCPHCGQVTELHDHAAVAALCASLSRAGHALARPEIEISALCARCYAASKLQANQLFLDSEGKQP